MPGRHRMPPVGWSERSEAQHRAVSDAFVGLRVAQTNLQTSQTCQRGSSKAFGARNAPYKRKSPQRITPVRALGWSNQLLRRVWLRWPSMPTGTSPARVTRRTMRGWVS